MEEISVKEKKYVKAKAIARELGYTNDYIGQLCRGGKIEAELVGRTWYVNPDSVKSHKKSRYRSSKVSTRRELQSDVVRALREETTSKRENFYSGHQLRPRFAGVAYETDESELVPIPKKQSTGVSLPVELADAEKVSVEAKNEKDYHFVAPKREEVRFFGTLKVTDFITDVPVADEGEGPQKVPVTSSRPQSTKQTKPAVIETKTPDSETTLVPLMAKPKPEPVADIRRNEVHMVPVEVIDEEVTLPIKYHLITAGALIGGMFLAAMSIGLQATVTATADQVVVAYSFAAENLAAQIYLLK